MAIGLLETKALQPFRIPQGLDRQTRSETRKMGTKAGHCWRDRRGSGPGSQGEWER